MGHLRERYNAKGRQSSTRPRKRTKHNGAHDGSEGNVDPNAEIILLKTDEEKAVQKKEKAKQEVCFLSLVSAPLLSVLQLLEQAESKFTSKKKKRLEKYIVRMLV